MTPADQNKTGMAGRTLEATLGLTRNTFYAGTHAAAFYFLLGKYPIGSLEFTCACFGGVVGACLWYAAARRTRQLMTMWNLFMAVTEAADPAPNMVYIFGSTLFRTLERRRIRNGTIFAFMILGVVFIWLALGIWSSVKMRWT